MSAKNYNRVRIQFMERLTKGKIIEIHVHDEYYVYAQVLQKGSIAYFFFFFFNHIQYINRFFITMVLCFFF